VLGGPDRGECEPPKSDYAFSMPKLRARPTKTVQLKLANLLDFHGFRRVLLVRVSPGIALITRGSSAWSTSCSYFADQFKSIGEDQGVAFSGRCGPPQSINEFREIIGRAWYTSRYTIAMSKTYLQ
jgi:hypothetical protein